MGCFELAHCQFLSLMNDDGFESNVPSVWIADDTPRTGQGVNCPEVTPIQGTRTPVKWDTLYS